MAPHELANRGGILAARSGIIANRERAGSAPASTPPLAQSGLRLSGWRSRWRGHPARELPRLRRRYFSPARCGIGSNLRSTHPRSEFWSCPSRAARARRLQSLDVSRRRDCRRALCRASWHRIYPLHYLRTSPRRCEGGIHRAGMVPTLLNGRAGSGRGIDCAREASRILRLSRYHRHGGRGHARARFAQRHEGTHGQRNSEQAPLLRPVSLPSRMAHSFSARRRRPPSSQRCTPRAGSHAHDRCGRCARQFNGDLERSALDS